MEYRKAHYVFFRARRSHANWVKSKAAWRISKSSSNNILDSDVIVTYYSIRLKCCRMLRANPIIFMEVFDSLLLLFLLIHLNENCHFWLKFCIGTRWRKWRTDPICGTAQIGTKTFYIAPERAVYCSESPDTFWIDRQQTDRWTTSKWKHKLFIPTPHIEKLGRKHDKNMRTASIKKIPIGIND